MKLENGMELDIMQALSGVGGPPRTSAAYAADMSVSDPLAYAPALITSPGNNFFDDIGFLASSYFGLTAESVNGRQEPIFRTNIFDKPTPEVTSFDRAQFARNARILSSIQGAGNYRFGQALQGLVGEDSALGRHAYATDRDGRYINPEAERTALRYAQSAAGNEMVAGQFLGLFNNVLGDDRGAGASVYAAHAKRIAAANSPTANAMQRDANGNLTFDPRRRTSRDQEVLESQYATLLNEAQDSALYKGGIVGDYDTKHGVSNTTIAKYLSAAAENGLVEDHSVMSDEDRERKAQVDDYNRQIDERARERKKYQDKQKELMAQGKFKEAKKYDVNIQQETAAIEGMEQTRDEIQSKITTHDGFGTLREAAQKRADMQAEVDRYREEAYGKDGRGGVAAEVAKYGKALEDLNESGRSSIVVDGRKMSRDEVEGAYKASSAQLDDLNGKADDVSQKIRDMTDNVGQKIEKLSQTFTGAVDALKDLYGTEEEAAKALEKLTRGRHASEDGESINADMESTVRELVKIGQGAGISPTKMGMILTGMAEMTQTAFGLSGQDAALMGSPDRHMALLGASYAAKAANGAKTPEEAARAIAGAQYGLNQGLNSGVYKTLVQARAEVGKTITQEEFDQLSQDLASGDNDTRIAARNRFYEQAYGSVEAGKRIASSAVSMAHIRDSLTDEGLGEVEAGFKNAREADARRYKGRAEDESRLSRSRARARQAGYTGQEMADVEDEAGLNAVIEALQAEEGNDDAQFAAESIQKEFDLVKRKEMAAGRTEEEATRRARSRALSLYRNSFKDTLGGDTAERIENERAKAASNALDEYSQGSAIADENFDESALGQLASESGIVEENGDVSRGNLGQAMDVVTKSLRKLGDEQLSEMGLDSKSLSDIEDRMRKARESGNFEEVSRIYNEEIDPKLGNEHREMLVRSIKRAGIETEAKRKERRDAAEKSEAHRQEVAARQERLSTGTTADAEGGVAKRSHVLNLEKETAAVRPPTEEEAKAEGDELREAADRTQSTREIAIQVAEGRRPKKDLLLNPDISPENQEEAVGRAAEMAGGAVTELIGMVNPDGSYGAAPVDTLSDGAPGSPARPSSGWISPTTGKVADTMVSPQFTSAKTGAVGTATTMFASLNDDEFERYYHETFGENADPSKANKLRHRMLESRTEKGRTAAAKDLNRMFQKQTKKARVEAGKEGDKERETALRRTEERFRDDFKALGSGNYKIGSEEAAKLKDVNKGAETRAGKYDGGGSNGLQVQLMQKMDMLIASMSGLVGAIKSTYGNR